MGVVQYPYSHYFPIYPVNHMIATFEFRIYSFILDGSTLEPVRLRLVLIGNDSGTAILLLQLIQFFLIFPTIWRNVLITGVEEGDLTQEPIEALLAIILILTMNLCLVKFVDFKLLLRKHSSLYHYFIFVFRGAYDTNRHCRFEVSFKLQRLNYLHYLVMFLDP